MMVSSIVFTALLAAPSGTFIEHGFHAYAERARMQVVLARTVYTPVRRAYADERISAWFELAARRGLPVPDRIEDMLEGHSLDLTQESFDLYVPATRPERGFAMLVYVPPSPSFVPPVQWRRVFADRGFILVVPRNAGNNDQLFLRRIPLALHAHANVADRYPVDPERTYVGGFSGGARTALALALGYPEVFVGALVIGGSGPLAGEHHDLPDDPAVRALVAERTRVVLASGDRDTAALRSDVASARSLRALGVAVHRMVLRNTGHAEPGGAELARALGYLEAGRPD